MELLFEKGKSLHAPPLKLVYLSVPENATVAQAMFVVPKRLFKKASDRNKLKRRMREAYRLAKSDFYLELTQNKKWLHLAFLYTAKDMRDYATISAALKNLLDRFLKK